MDEFRRADVGIRRAGLGGDGEADIVECLHQVGDGFVGAVLVADDGDRGDSPVHTGPILGIGFGQFGVEAFKDLLEMVSTQAPVISSMNAVWGSVVFTRR